jgi:glycosyltransferase involved in cell wall biosynthesis
VKEKALAMGIQDSILFLGQMADVSDWYQVMDCFVMPSLFEGLPVVGIEAQASGLPCVFSDRVTDEVLLSGSARRVPLTAGDAEWAEEILSVRSSGEERAEGRDIVRKAGYDIHEEARKLQQLYLDMAARAYPEAEL